MTEQPASTTGAAQPGRKNPSGDHSPTSRAGMAVMAVVGVAAVILAIVLSDPTSTSSTATTTPAGQASSASVTPTGHTTEVTVGVDGMSFTPSTIEVPVGDELVITFENTGDQRHDLVLENGQSSGSVAPGDSVVIEAGVISQDMRGWCSLPGHEQSGMTLTIHATGATSTNAESHAAHSNDSHSGHAASSSSTVNAEDLIAYAQTVEPRDPKLAPVPEGNEHSYTFTVTEQTEQVTNNLTRETWTFNGTNPGPVLHGKVGDTFHITLVNEGTMSHSIDFHAGLVSPDENMRSIEPGETLKYTFVAENAGIWLYHCSTAPMSMHIANGMYGAVVIDPTDLDPVDHEYVMIAGELYLGGDGEVANAQKMAALQPDAMTFNGTAFQYRAHPISIKTGDRVRVWVLDAGPNIPLAFHVVGTQFDTVWREGFYEIRGGGTGGGAAQVLALQAAEGGFVEFTPLEAGHYNFVNHAMSLAEKGQQGTFEVTD
ncbi:multicopper oxidase domain-containing protein [Schaalia vaccimaxillae]|uniref:multicopper oxidase domain-containing protein n=1 Tax=Schaalia vaccimaxillae TaxID=183916 RepID=UPI0003B5BAC8|nr:multicopper oxidase domain-containing protein [Schaalia vaccimaxillae]